MKKSSSTGSTPTATIPIAVKNTPQQRYEELLKEYPEYHSAGSATLHSLLSRHYPRLPVPYQKSPLGFDLYNCYRLHPIGVATFVT